MKIMVIHNLADSVRRANIEQQFSNQIVQPGYEIIPAIMDVGMPRRGINQSHKLCIMKAKQERLEYVCIVEDDISFLNHNSLGLFLFNFYKFRDIMKDENQSWDMFMGGLYEAELSDRVFIPTPDHSGKMESGGISVVRVEGKISGLHLYIVSSDFYDTFLQADENINIDYELSVSLGAEIFCVTPFLALQGNFPSANGNNMEEINGRLGLKYKLIQPEPKI